MIPKIRARGVARSFPLRGRTITALGPLDLEVAAGEFVCLVGPSGCGKSTFLKVLAGLLGPTYGEVEILRREAGRLPTAMVFQDCDVYPWKTVAANVRLGLDLRRVRRAEGNRRVREWLSRVGLLDFADAYPGVLSGGMRQRVAIARALVVEPDVLLMDEPFAALDAQLRRLLQEELLRIWETDRRTVVFVTHSVEEAILLGDRVVVLSARPGHVIGDFRVPFPRPRASGLRAAAAFAELEAQVWGLLRAEVERTLAGTRPSR